MKGIFLEDIDKNTFLKFLDKVSSIEKQLSVLVDAKQNEKITVEEAANEIGVTPQTMYKYIKDGRVKAYMLGKSYLITRSDLGNAMSEVKSLKYKRD